MSLMESLRSGTDSTAMQVILGLVVVSFIAAYGFQGNTESVYVTVNGEPVLRPAATQELNRLRRQLGHLANEDESMLLQQRARENIIARVALRQRAEELGLVVSQREIVAVEVRDPSFQVGGLFDDKRMESVLRNQRTTRAAYEDDIREQLLIQKLYDTIVLGVDVPDAMLRDAWLQNYTQVNLDAVRVRATAFFDDADVSDAQVQELLEKRLEAAKTRYEQDKSRLYDVPAKLQLSVIRLGYGEDAAAAKERMSAVMTRLQAGEDFAALAKELSEDVTALRGGAMPAMTLEALGDEVVASVRAEGDSFVAAGQVGKVVEGAEDVRLFRVDAYEPAVHKEFDDAREDVARRILAEERAPAAAIDFARSIRKTWSTTGEAPVALIEEKGLELKPTGLVGLAQKGAFVPPADLLAAASTAPVGTVIDGDFDADGVYWVAKLTERVDADFSALEADKERIRASLANETTNAALMAWRDEVVSQAEIR